MFVLRFITSTLIPFVVVATLGGLLIAMPDDARAFYHHKAGRHYVRHFAARYHSHANISFARPQPSSFIVDADTGKILEAENADAPRYPASLTKMMTLYLTFDALKKGRMTMQQLLPVSAHAASQPQTNIALKPGDHIAVKDAILSIVIRSANDSAVTLGEALGGGSEPAFAQIMTQTARRLGMSNTYFYNASGLPEPAQHTTARDMATLGLALKAHFPQYFPFFKTESFSYQGITYVTHNHVMMRYEGVDGIKTGFIRASGFNLVTSANRYGHHLVGVVMGGPTWRARDDKMIALLNATFTQLVLKDGGKNVHLASAERTKAKGAGMKAETADDNAEGEGDLPGEMLKSAVPPISGSPRNPPVATAMIVTTPPAPGPALFSPSISATNPSNNPVPVNPAISHWGIQVGAFARSNEAKTAASRAMKLAPQELANSVIVVASNDDTATIHRARLINLTQEQAQNACHKLTALKGPCFVYKAN